MDQPPTLHTPRLLLRPPRDGDLEALARILREPAVSRWWPDYDDARVRRELIERDEDVTVMAIVHHDAVIGAIQFGEEADPQYRHASLDLFLSEAAQGRGMGPEAIRAVVDHLARDRGHHRIVIDPAAANTRAVRAYARVGFRPVGVMRRYERGADGTWHDGLLMEWTDDAPAAAPSPLRAATLDDVPALLDMMDAFNRLEGIPWSRNDCDGALRKLLCDATLGAVGLVVEGAETVGYFVLTWGYDLEWQGRDAWLTEFYLLEGVRGRRLGARALEAVGSFAKAHDARALHLMVREDNAPAMRLYRRAGFEPPPRVCLSKGL